MQRISWEETRDRLRADHARLVDLRSYREQSKSQSAYLSHSFIAVLLHRLSYYFNCSGHPWLARFIRHFNLLITGADISEPANLGAGLVIISPPGVAIMGRSGVNLTVMPCSGMGAEIGRYEDIGAGPGCCVVGDDVLLEPHSGVLGPVRVGNRVTIGSGVSVAKDVPDDYKVEGPKPRFLARKDLSI